MRFDPETRSRRRHRSTVAASVAAAALFVTGGAVAVADAVAGGPTARPAQQAAPNFACLAIGNYGICIGPPTA